MLYPDVNAEAVEASKIARAAQDAADVAEEARMEAEMELQNEWDTAMMNSGAEEAFYNGDKGALIVSLNSAITALEN